MAIANNQGIRIYYEVIGTGKPMVLYHGLGDSSRGWSEFGYLPELARHRQLILIDGRGHGRSDKPYEHDAYSPDRLASDILRVAMDLGLQCFDYLGCSMGGWAGFALATKKPQCLNSLIINGAHPYAQNLGYLRELLAQDLESWAQLIAEQTAPQQINLQRLFENDLRALQALLSVDRPDLSQVLDQLRCPILFLSGEHDPAKQRIKTAAATAHKAIFRELSGCNHFSAISCSEQSIATITQFLASLEQQSFLTLTTTTEEVFTNEKNI